MASFSCQGNEVPDNFYRQIDVVSAEERPNLLGDRQLGRQGLAHERLACFWVSANPDQVAKYDDGVGSSSFKPLALLGGAFGWGLKRNVVGLYKFICGDKRATPEDVGTLHHEKRQPSNLLAASAFGTLVRRLMCSASGERLASSTARIPVRVSVERFAHVVVV
jgi:Uncharacterized alpha/beta hydrolase domain (DUF2235)